MKSTNITTFILTFLVFLFGAAIALPAPAAQASVPDNTDADFINTVLSVVNNYRAQYSADPLTWDNGLASFALENANTCSGVHSVSHPFSCPRSLWPYILLLQSLTPAQSCQLSSTDTLQNSAYGE